VLTARYGLNLYIKCRLIVVFKGLSLTLEPKYASYQPNGSIPSTFAASQLTTRCTVPYGFSSDRHYKHFATALGSCTGSTTTNISHTGLSTKRESAGVCVRHWLVYTARPQDYSKPLAILQYYGLLACDAALRYTFATV